MALTEELAWFEELFHRALDLPEERRDAFVAEACGGDTALVARVEALLREHGDADPWDDEPGTLRPGERVGAFRIVRRIGAGGMGAVYEAVQAVPSVPSPSRSRAPS